MPFILMEASEKALSKCNTHFGKEMEYIPQGDVFIRKFKNERHGFESLSNIRNKDLCKSKCMYMNTHFKKTY